MEHPLQHYLLEKIIKRYQKKTQAVDELCQILNVHKDAIYRRLRGDTLLTPKELTELANHYKISLDAFVFKNSDAVMFTFNPFSLVVKTFEDYLEAVYRDVILMQKLPMVKVWYASAEIPLFYYIVHPEIINFKLYVWGRTVWQFDYLQNKKYHKDIIPYTVVRKAEETHHAYRQIPTLELWTLNLMDNTLNQVEYHLITGLFQDPNDALVICDKMMDLTWHMQAMAEHGRKFAHGKPPESSGATFELYHNEMIYTNNTIYVQSPTIRVVFTTHGNPNFLKTSEERMCDYTHKWFESVITKSSNISLQGEKGRKWYFDQLRRRIIAVRSRLEQSL
jgi:hypothetical protein